jgi:hypothetical protein
VVALVLLVFVLQKLIPLVTAEQVLLQPFQEQLLLMLEAVVAVGTPLDLIHRVVLAVVAMVAQKIRLVVRGLQTLAVEVVEQETLQGQVKLVVLVVQALSFFATPVQFNISLVAQ